MSASNRAVLDAVRKRLADEPDRVLLALRVLADPEALVDPADESTVALARSVNAHRIVALLREFRARSYTTEQVREMLGGVSRQAVSQRVANKRLLAIEISGRSHFPDWQFVDGRLVDGLAPVLAELQAVDAAWLAADALMRTPITEAGDRSPAQLLAAGEPDLALHYIRVGGSGL